MRELAQNEMTQISGGFNNGGYGFMYVVNCAALGLGIGFIVGAAEAGLTIGACYGALVFTAATLDSVVFTHKTPSNNVYLPA